MKKLIFSICAIGLLLACRSENKDKKIAHTITAENDTLTFRYDSVKVVSNNLPKPFEGIVRDSTYATVYFPIFENEQLNRYIMASVFNFYDEKERPTSYQDLASSFVRGYNEFFIESPGTTQSWFLDINIQVLRQTHNYIALQHTNSDYAGGAHGNTSIYYLNYNPKTNQPITLDSLIQADKKSELLKIAETIFRKDEKLSPSAPLGSKYFFDNDQFALAQQFFVSKNGLEFIYNAYEIKAYAYGTTTLVIPFEELKNISKPNTILTPNADI